MRFEALQARLTQVSAWPDLARVFERAGDVPRPDWDLPIRACRALGGTEAVAVPVATAVACLQISIILVDDVLDDDERGAHRQIGSGRAANMAAAFQAAAFRLITSAGYPAEISNQICDCLAEVAAATAYGQQLDVQNLRGEEAYWRVIHAKSTPFYAGALKTGGMAAGGQAPQLAALAEFGTCIGEMIQLEDDLNDALQTPANADWGQGRNNLVILYARTAEHPGRQRFVELLTKIGANGALEEAQQLLFTSGAVSYCAYLLVSRFGRARRMLAQAQLPNAAVLAEILDQYSASLLSLLRLSGIDLAPQFLESFQSAPAGDPPRSRPPSA